MQKRDADTRFGQAVGRLETEQAATDDHRRATSRDAAQHALDIVHGAKRDDARKVHARVRQADRVRSGGDDELGIGEVDPILEGQCLCRAVNRGDRLPEDVGDAIAAPPGARLQLEVVGDDFVGKQRRQQHAIVGASRFGPDEDDGVAAEGAGAQLLGELGAGHALADNDERFAHDVSRCLGVIRSRLPRTSGKVCAGGSAAPRGPATGVAMPSGKFPLDPRPVMPHIPRSSSLAYRRCVSGFKV